MNIAVKQNKRHIVNLLLENQEPNLTEIDKDGDTLLHSIIKYKMRDLVEKFLSESALNKEGQTLLHLSLTQGTFLHM